MDVNLKVKPKPIIKWVGGKTKLLSNIIKNLPEEFNNYFEPFTGGASVAIEIVKRNRLHPKKYTVSDVNKSLINCYTVVCSNFEELVVELRKDVYQNALDKYIQNRDRFNAIKNENTSEVERAALFIYLNKCGFNGMYRENLSGKYNIPFGKMNNPTICDIDTLTNFKNMMQNVNIVCCEYQDVFDEIQENDFVYLDPPYHDTFTDYHSSTFGEKEQTKLKVNLDNLHARGVKFMVSNSATKFIKELYSSYNVVEIETKYSVGGAGVERNKKKQEVLIKNY